MKLLIIDISGKRELVEYIQLKEEAEKAAVFNFFALEMLGNKLNIAPTGDLMPLLSPKYEGDEASREFDERYAYQLANHPNTKYDLMIMLEQLQLKEEVILVCNYNHPTVLPIIDSICKYIQQRYSLNAFLASDLEDIDPFELSDFETNEGYDNYIRDLAWLSDMRGDVDKEIEKLKEENKK